MDFPNSLNVTTDNLQIPDKSVDVAFALLSAHEIRKTPERITFFKEIKRVLKDDGRIVVTEHLRDIPNFLGYNIGFFHFLFKHTWLKTFKGAGLKVVQKTKVTPFITNFVLAKNGNPS
jgi:ubiquinone/menaquinone biosynthesis C-methylase UbiE